MPYLAEAVDSILCQTLSDFEFVIVDDGSTDGTPEYLRGIKDPRVSIIRQDNGGTAAAANHGLENVSTRFVARMDADDISLPDRLAKQLAFMKQNPDVGVLGSQVVPVGSSCHGKSLALPCTHEELFSDMMSCKHGLAHSSVMIDADRLKSIGGYWSLRLIDRCWLNIVFTRDHSTDRVCSGCVAQSRTLLNWRDAAKRTWSLFPTKHLLRRSRKHRGRKIAGTLRLGFAALLSPRLTIDRVGRMMRFSGRPDPTLQPQASALTANNNEADLDVMHPPAVSATAENCAETKTGSFS